MVDRAEGGEQEEEEDEFDLLVKEVPMLLVSVQLVIFNDFLKSFLFFVPFYVVPQSVSFKGHANLLKSA